MKSHLHWRGEEHPPVSTGTHEPPLTAVNGSALVPRTSEPEPPLADRLQAWVGAGLITSAEARRIALAEGLPVQELPEAAEGVPELALREAVPPEPRMSLVVEALGYLGGIIILSAVGLLTARYWEQTGTAFRLAVTAGAAVALLLAGAALPVKEAASRRLGSVLWTLSVVAAGTFFGLLGGEAWNWNPEHTFLLVGLGTSAYAGALWWRRTFFVQQMTFGVALCVLAAASTVVMNGPDHLPGLAIWGVGLAWFLLGWGGVVSPARLVMVVSSVVMVVGAMFTLPTDAGIILGLVTATGVVVTAVVFGELVLLAIGALAFLNLLPVAITTWLPGKLGAPLALLLVGAGLVGTAIETARRRKQALDAGAAGGTRTSRITYGQASQHRMELLAAGSVVVVAVVVIVLSAV